MPEVTKGSKTELGATGYSVSVTGAGAVSTDVLAVLLDKSGRVRSDSDLIFFNNPSSAGLALITGQSVQVDLNTIPEDVERVLIAASTEAQGIQFGDAAGIAVEIVSPSESFTFRPPSLSSETVVQLVAMYRRNGRWRLDAIGQGYADGLKSFATDFGITVDDDETADPPPKDPVVAPINMAKVSIALTKDSLDKTATIDLRKSGGDPNWVLTVGLEWDGRGAEYGSDGRVKRYGTGDLDVYFFCRNEVTNDYVVISGEHGHRGDLRTWPFVYHYGDSLGPGNGNRPAVEQVRVIPQENGDLLVNIYQSVDNGAGAINTFGRPRCVIRYGRAQADGMPGPDADEIKVFVGNNRDSYWATVAHIDVQDGILTVDGKTRYSMRGSEHMPGLSTAGKWVKEPLDGPIGRSKSASGLGLTHYGGKCQPTRRSKQT